MQSYEDCSIKTLDVEIETPFFTDTATAHFLKYLTIIITYSLLFSVLGKKST